MKINKKYWLVISPLAGLLILVIAWALRGNEFRDSAKEIHRLSLEPGYFLSPMQVDSLRNANGILVVDIREAETYAAGHPDGAVNIPFKSLLERHNLRLIKNSSESIIIYSDDMSISAGAWALLSQLGVNDVYLAESAEEAKTVE